MYLKKKASNLYAPAPGNYKIENATGISKDGKYFVSTLHSSGVRSFPKEERRTGSTGKGMYIFNFLKIIKKELPPQEAIDYHLNLDIMRQNINIIKVQIKKNDNIRK